MSHWDDAKEMFMKYEGSFSYMESEGVYDRYRRFGVSLAQAGEWEDERQATCLRSLEVEEDPIKAFDKATGLLFAIINWRIYRHLPGLLDIVESKNPKLDSFSKVGLSELLLTLIRKIRSDTNGKKHVNVVHKIAASLLLDVMASPDISVANRDLRYVAEPEDVRKRAEKCYAQLRTLGHGR